MSQDVRARLVPVILSGGSGSRLWPLSRDLYPKQLLALTGERSLLQQTAVRAALAAPAQRPIVVCNEDHRFMVAEQLRELDSTASSIMLEPVGRNTAPAIAVAAHQARALAGHDALMLVLPADHVIPDTEAFTAAVERAAATAASGRCVTFGIVPTRPETGFGYIHAPGEGEEARTVAAFVEKPARERAEAFLAAGGHFWNSGMFVFPAARFLELLGRHEPAMAACAQRAWEGAERDLDFTRLDAAAFSECPADSVDYAVMERIDDAAMVPLDAGWDDVGSWSALWSLAEQDRDGNARIGDVIAIDTRGSYLRSEHRLVAAIGLEDVVVIETGDAVLVAKRGAVQDVKRIVQQLKAEGRSEHVAHTETFRPWGSHEHLTGGDRYEVKRVRIRPGGSQSLQRHLHRAEHWVVVEGTARVTRGEETLLLAENESAFIPTGVVHRIENPGRVDLEMVEIRTGAYLGEDDIERL
ncbi:MAG: mannose-1-phosphate guanylyltransferase/mannose-6-phosphate isomerase [Pseudomonadales bacterium]|jgi:mannose-1-phosphate guanylyltransferase/mannose-6-phosphate isomerase|nr:mannose-1-phosphate guanylyltransferase/mannose-6-phosphate isomerase [Pseudomonadales bacterium]